MICAFNYTDCEESQSSDKAVGKSKHFLSQLMDIINITDNYAYDAYIFPYNMPYNGASMKLIKCFVNLNRKIIHNIIGCTVTGIILFHQKDNMVPKHSLITSCIINPFNFFCSTFSKQ